MKKRQIDILKVISLGSELLLPGMVVSVEMGDEDFTRLVSSGFISEYKEQVIEDVK